MKIAILLYIFTNAQSIVEPITTSQRSRKLRLINEISDIRQSYKHKDIGKAAWTFVSQNFADNFARCNVNATFTKIMRTGKLHFMVEQWIYKEDYWFSLLKMI